MPRSAPTFRPRRTAAPRHNPRGAGERNRQQTRAMHTGSKAWRQLREQILQRDGCTCAGCGCYGDQVDHVDGDSHNNDMRNLQTLCIVCHGRKTREEQDGHREATEGAGRTSGNP